MPRSKRDDSLENYTNPVNISDWVSVSKRLVFMQDQGTGSFYAKIKLVNRSPRHVSFKVSSTSQKKFDLLPSFGNIKPWGKVEVVVTTRKSVRYFCDVLNEAFHVFAFPVYDVRKLASIKTLWEVHGTKHFPYESTEEHNISLLFPKNDKYYQYPSFLERIGNLTGSNSEKGLNRKFRVMKPENKKVVEEFRQNWLNRDSDIDSMLNDWNYLADSIHIQTEKILESTHLTFTMLAIGALTTIWLGFIGTTDIVQFFERPEVKVNLLESMDDSSYLSRIGFWNIFGL